jgi:CheY-like chemotaxis protein
MAVAGTLAYANDDELSNNLDGLQVLLVEDDAADAYLIKCALSKSPRVGSIVSASDGVSALRAIEQGGAFPDLAIIDLQMPRMDGFRFLVELGCRPQYRFPKFVLTSSTSRSDLLRSRLRRADRIMHKPDTLQQLEVLLSNAIEKI